MEVKTGRTEKRRKRCRVELLVIRSWPLERHRNNPFCLVMPSHRFTHESSKCVRAVGSAHAMAQGIVSTVLRVDANGPQSRDCGLCIASPGMFWQRRHIRKNAEEIAQAARGGWPIKAQRLAAKIMKGPAESVVFDAIFPMRAIEQATPCLLEPAAGYPAIPSRSQLAFLHTWREKF